MGEVNNFKRTEKMLLLVEGGKEEVYVVVFAVKRLNKVVKF